MNNQIFPYFDTVFSKCYSIFISEFFKTLENIDFAGYADDNTHYKYSSKIGHPVNNLQGASEKLSLVFCKSLDSKC